MCQQRQWEVLQEYTVQGVLEMRRVMYGHLEVPIVVAVVVALEQLEGVWVASRHGGAWTVRERGHH
jgi:hypothetical protein